METKWFNALFEDNFEEDYDDVMNHVVHYINYNDGNYDIGGVGDDGDTDDDDNDDSDNDSDEDYESFWKWDLDYYKLTLCLLELSLCIYLNYVHKESCMTSYEIGMRWLIEILKGHWKQYLNIFKMDATTF